MGVTSRRHFALSSASLPPSHANYNRKCNESDLQSVKSVKFSDNCIQINERGHCASGMEVKQVLTWLNWMIREVFCCCWISILVACVNRQSWCERIVTLPALNQSVSHRLVNYQQRFVKSLCLSFSIKLVKSSISSLFFLFVLIINLNLTH